MLKSWLQRIFGSTRARASSAIAPPSADVLDQVRRQIDADVAGGFATKEDIIESTVDIHGDDHGDPAELRRLATQLVVEAFQAHASKQAEWSEPTDCDRLDAAFVVLESDGIISRQNFSCCGTCGAAEIWDEIDAAKDAGRPARGYAFYHMQDTESAAEGYGLYLNYGACEEAPEAAIAIGHEIVTRLKQHDIQTEWDGTIERRIAVSLDWKRRRHNLQA